MRVYGDKQKKREERTRRIGIRQGERTRRREARANRRRNRQNEKMSESVDQALNSNTLLENKETAMQPMSRGKRQQLDLQQRAMEKYGGSTGAMNYFQHRSEQRAKQLAEKKLKSKSPKTNIKKPQQKLKYKPVSIDKKRTEYLY